MNVITPDCGDFDFEIKLIEEMLIEYVVDVWDVDGDRACVIPTRVTYDSEGNVILCGFRCDLDDGHKLEETPTWWLFLRDITKIEVF